MKRYLTILILFGVLSATAWADYTVNKIMSEPFQMYNADGTARTNADLSKFTTKTYKDNVRQTQTWTFRNQSTGDYTASTTPATAGFYKVAIYYNNTSIGAFSDTVRLYDNDDTYGTTAKDSTVAKASTMGTPMQAGASVTVGTNNDKTGYSLSTTPLSATTFANWTGAHKAQFARLDVAVSSVSSGGSTTIYVNALPGSTAYASPATSGSEISMYAGDTVSIKYKILDANKLPLDLTTWTVKMAVKKNVTDTAYVIAARDVTASIDSPATLGTGTVSLTNADTKNIAPGKYVMDIQISKTGNQYVTSRVFLNINTPVIK